MSTDIILPFAVLFIVGFGLLRKTDVFSAFIRGAKEGLSSAAGIFPSLCFLMTAVSLLRESGAVDLVTGFIAPAAEKAGFPPEVLPLALLRPFSGAGALAFYEEICSGLESGSFAERAASVLMGGSETTFYTVAVYFGAAGIKKSGNTVPAALFADISAAVLSILAVRLFIPPA